VERRAKEQGKEREYEVMRPFLTGETGGGKAEEGARVLGLTGGAFKVAVHRMRARFREALREEVRETQGEGDDVEEEMGYLMRVLQAGG
jgi:RNA polymerase sigma-70 factor (ECF subfamily)